MKAKELKVEYVSIDEIKPYAGNAKLHPAEQIEQIKESIEKFGMNDPIAVWKDGEIIEGHGRFIALKELGEEKLKELGLTKIPIIRLDSLTEKQRKAYALVHNKLTMNSGFDFSLLQEELKELDEFDMGDFGFGDFELGNFDEDFEPEPFDKEIEQEYGEQGLVSFNVIISCLSEEEKEWLKGILKEDKDLHRLYECSALMERFGEESN